MMMFTVFVTFSAFKDRTTPDINMKEELSISGTFTRETASFQHKMVLSIYTHSLGHVEKRLKTIFFIFVVVHHQNCYQIK